MVLVNSAFMHLVRLKPQELSLGYLHKQVESKASVAASFYVLLH